MRFGGGKVKPGGVWVLGQFAVVCAVLSALSAETADATVQTDPLPECENSGCHRLAGMICIWRKEGAFATVAMMSEITLLLDAITRGESHTCDELLPLVYDELRRLAAARMAQESAGQTLQPTALVHEAWLRLVGEGDRTWENRAHFFGAAAEAMKRILIERARRKSRLKRGGGHAPLNIEDFEVAAATPDERVLLIEEGLQRLAAQAPELARIVTLKFFGGLTNREVAETLGVTERTVLNHWAYARAWLLRDIASQARP